MKNTRGRKVRRTAPAAFTVAAVAACTASAGQPAAAAASCSSPYIAILPAFHQHRSTKRVAASVVNQFNGAPILGKEWRTFDAGQKWRKTTVSGFVTYTNVTTRKRLTYKPGDGTARFRLENAGAEGQLFKHRFIACP